MPIEHYHLPFADLALLERDLVEVVVHEGIVLDLPRVQEYHRFLNVRMPRPFRILVHKLNNYSYDFHAQRLIGRVHGVTATAVVAYDEISVVRTKLLGIMPRYYDWKIKIFDDHGEALTWLNDPARSDARPARQGHILTSPIAVPA